MNSHLLLVPLPYSDNVPPRDADIAARLTADYRPSGLLVVTACTIRRPHITGLWHCFDPIEALSQTSPALAVSKVRTLLTTVYSTLRVDSDGFFLLKLGCGASSRVVRLGPVRVVHRFRTLQ